MDALLDTAIKTHDGELAERVVKYVGNVNAKSGGVYVLHWAAETGDLEIVKLLLDGGDFWVAPGFDVGEQEKRV